MVRTFSGTLPTFKHQPSVDISAHKFKAPFIDKINDRTKCFNGFIKFWMNELAK